MDKVLKFTPALFVLFSFSACVSEPLSRNCVRVLFIIFFAMICTKNFSLRDAIPYKKILSLMAAFLAWLMFSYLWGGMKIPLSHDSIEWILFSHDMIIFLLLGVMISEEKFFMKILNTLALSLMIDNFYIFYQAAQGVERPLTFLHGSIAQSTMLYIILLPMLLVLMLKKISDRREKIFYQIIFFLSLAACIMINTRGAWLDLAIVLPFILAYRLRNLKKFFSSLIIFITVGGIFLVSSPQTFHRLQTITTANSEQSVTERFLMWQSAINAIEDNPLMGVGLGNYEEEYQEKYILDEAKERYQGHAHNVFLQFWAETGLPGIILYCALFGYILFWSWRRAKNFYALIIFSATLDLMLYSLTDYTFASYSSMRVYWLMFAACVAGIKLSERKNFSL